MRVTFTIDAHAWLKKQYPWMKSEIDNLGNGFRCKYTLYERPGKGTYYRLETEDGRTNYNDLNSYEKMCLYGCFDFYEGHLDTVFLPWTETGIDYCIDIDADDSAKLPTVKEIVSRL